jgi:hypothetical protein
MSYTIFDNGGSLKILRDGRTLFITKSTITEITVIRENVIKLGRANCINSIYIRHPDVSSPFAFNATTLAILLNSWVANAPLPPPND